MAVAGPAAAQTDRLVPFERAARHPVVADKPAQDFFEGALLGNGGLGAVVRTRPDSILVCLGHNDVWDIRLAEENRDRLLPFEEIWARVKRDTPEDRAWFRDYCRMARENYARPYPRPWPCGAVLLGFDRRRAELLGHRLRIDIGRCEVDFLIEGRRATLEIFADMVEDRLWLRMVDEAGRPCAAPFDRVRLLAEPGMETDAGPEDRPPAFRQVLPVLGDAREKDRALRVSTAFAEGTMPRPGGDAGAPFVACVQLEHGLAGQVPGAAAGGPAASPEAFRAAAEASLRVWKDYWNRSGVALDDAFLERIWYLNTYFLNCAVRPGSACPGLFANWSCRNIGTAWHGDYHTNYNLQQPFWVTFSSNRLDKNLAYVDLVHFLLPLAKSWAAEHYRLPGAFFPHSAYPVEMTMNPYPVPTWGAQVCETPWVVQGLWWHYLYTMDEAFLRDRAFVPIREATAFLNAYMRRPEARGPQWGDDRFHIYPTVVPELHGLRPDPRFCADCNVDLTLTKFVFKAFLEACRVLGVESREQRLAAEVREILAHFPEYPTADGPYGRVFVSVAGESPEQVYNTPNPLMSVFPGEDIGPDSPPELLEIALNTWRGHRNEGGNELVFLNLQGARLGVLDLERFKRQIRYCLLPNGTATDMVLQAGGRYADDTDYGFMARMGVWFENFALPVVINECLLQSVGGTLRFFPNWPADRDAEFRNLRTVGAFLVSARRCAGSIRWIEALSEAGGPLRLLNPWPGGVRVICGPRESLLRGSRLEIPTAPGDRVRLAPAPPALGGCVP